MDRDLLAMLMEYLLMQQTSGGASTGGDLPYDDYGIQDTIGGLGAVDPNTYVAEDWADTGIAGAGAGSGGNLESATMPPHAPPPPAGYSGGRRLGEPSPGAAEAMAVLAEALAQSQQNPNRVPGDVQMQRTAGAGPQLAALDQGFDQYSRGEFNYIPTFADTHRPTVPGPGMGVLDKVGLQGARAVNNIVPPAPKAAQRIATAARQQAPAPRQFSNPQPRAAAPAMGAPATRNTGVSPLQNAQNLLARMKR